MSDFVQTMKDWKRLCDSMDKKYSDDCCKNCPLYGFDCGGIFEMPKNTNWQLLQEKVGAWAAEHPEPVYPTWLEFIKRFETGKSKSDNDFIYWMGTTSIPANIAEKLGLKPKEGKNDV